MSAGDRSAQDVRNGRAWNSRSAGEHGGVATEERVPSSCK